MENIVEESNTIKEALSSPENLAVASRIESFKELFS